MPNEPIDLRRIKRELKGREEEETSHTAEVSVSEAEVSAFPAGDESPRFKNALAEWEAWESEIVPGRAKILLALGGILIAGAAPALFFRNFLFASLLVVSGFAIAANAFRPPRRLRFAVSSRGMFVGGRLFEFKMLKSFWIFYDPPHSKDISFVSQKTLMPTIRVPLGDLDPVRIRKILLKFIPEVEHEESLIDIIAKRLGF